MSETWRYCRRMKTRTKKVGASKQVATINEELIATFGEARLVRVNGTICLRGGTMADRMEALEWLSLMMPETVVCIDD